MRALWDEVGPSQPGFVTDLSGLRLLDLETARRHRRAFSWIATGVDRDAFEAELLVTLNGQHTVQELNLARAVSRLRSLAELGVDPGPQRR